MDEILEELGADGNKSGVEIEIDRTFSEPFDPATISIESKVVPMETLLRRLRTRTIKLAPNFQRGYVWDIEKSSQLIESLMLRIPLPMFYVASDKKGNWDVVDGLQRLTTIRNFILGCDEQVPEAETFRLKNLEFWGAKFDGKNFSEIEADKSNSTILNNILETEMRFTVINPGTPEEVKRNIFKRINTGGMPLTPQEIRHALYQGKASQLLIDLVKSNEFISAVDNTINDSRMAGRELIIRFIAFYLRDISQFNGDMDKFLSDTMRLINGDRIEGNCSLRINLAQMQSDAEALNGHITSKFKLSMTRSEKFFKTYAFRKAVLGQRRTPVNKALFEVWSNVFAEMKDEDFNRLCEHRNTFFEKYLMLLASPEFDRAISRDASSIISSKERYRKVHELINEVLGG